MPTLIFATNNAHKAREIRAALGSSWEIRTLQDAGVDIDIPEPHDTLEENAREKSTTIHRITGMDCFSEDTGLEVETLGGAPGVKSARFAGDSFPSIPPGWAGKCINTKNSWLETTITYRRAT